MANVSPHREVDGLRIEPASGWDGRGPHSRADGIAVDGEDHDVPRRRRPLHDDAPPQRVAGSGPITV